MGVDDASLFVETRKAKDKDEEFTRRIIENICGEGSIRQFNGKFDRSNAIYYRGTKISEGILDSKNNKGISNGTGNNEKSK